MKITDSPNSLDGKIDNLLASQPLKPSSDFTARVLAEANKLNKRRRSLNPVKRWLPLGLPIAALIIAAWILTPFISTKPIKPTQPSLTTIELQEIFILEEGLAGLSQLQDEDMVKTDLLDILDSLSRETQS